MRTDRRGFVRLAVAAVAVAAGGCGGGPATGTVTGTVSHAGKPLAGGTVTFAPKAGGEAAPVTAEIQSDGTFAAADVPYGDLLVGVRPAEAGEDTTAKPTNPSAPPPPKPAPPPWAAKYADPFTSGLSLTLGEPTRAFPIELK